MPQKQFLILYPDRSKDRIGCAERDSLLLAKAIKFKATNVYEYVGEVQTLHSFADLRTISLPQRLSAPVRRFLQGSFVIENRMGRRYEERLETPEAMEMNLPTRIAQLEAAGA